MTQSTFPTAGTQQPYGPPYGPSVGPPAPPFGYPPPPKRRTGLIVGSILGALVIAAGLVVGALLLFGTKTLDRADAQRQVAGAADRLIGVTPDDVSCPADVEIKAGSSFTCTASVEDQPVSFTVTQEDDAGHVTIATDNAYVPVSDVEGDVSAQIEEEAQVSVTTTCDAGGRTVLVDPAGTALTCTVTNAQDSSRSIEVNATVEEDGSVTLESADA